MSLTILPRSGDPGGAAAAQHQLQTIINDVLNVVMVVYGEGPEIERALEVVVGRAAADPTNVRRVVWCPDPGVLSKDQKRDYLRAKKVAVSIGLEDKVADSLNADEAQSGFSVERAFLRAEAQTPEDAGN